MSADITGAGRVKIPTGQVVPGAALVDISGAHVGDIAAPVRSLVSDPGVPAVRWLTSDGTDSGTIDAKGSHSVASPGIIYRGPAAGRRWRIYGLTVTVRDGGSASGHGGGWAPSEFGDLGAGLANGCLLRIYSTAGAGFVVQDLTPPLMSNLGMSALAESYTGFAQSGDVAWSWHWDGHATFGGPVEVRGDLGERLEFVVQDNTTGLLNLLASVSFREYDAP